VADYPIFHDELATSIMGVMLFPNSLEKARTWAGRFLSSGIAQQWSADGLLDQGRWSELLLSAAVDVALKSEIQQSMREGWVVGQVVTMLYAFVLKDPASAKWTRAINRTIQEWKLLGPSPGKSTVRKHLAAKRRVLHLWGAWALSPRRRDRNFPFVTEPSSSGYDGLTDTKVFLAEAEMLLDVLIKWARKHGQLWHHHLDADLFRLSIELAPPDRSENWPPGAGVLPVVVPIFFRPRKISI
jgi:hypothetical protein